VGEQHFLYLHAGEFMLARYREVVTTVLAYRDAKEKLVRRAAIALLPRLAAFAPERFAATYLPVSTAHLLSILRTPGERGVGEGFGRQTLLSWPGTGPAGTALDADQATAGGAAAS
jgi:hypothetical protein